MDDRNGEVPDPGKDTKPAPVTDSAQDLEVSLFRVKRGLSIGIHPASESPKAVKPGIAARYLALGHRLAESLRTGEARTLNDLAHVLGVSSSRVSMLLTLTFLAPDLQEALLSGKIRPPRGGFHRLLEVARVPSWAEQRRMWSGTLPEG